MPVTRVVRGLKLVPMCKLLIVKGFVLLLRKSAPMHPKRRYFAGSSGGAIYVNLLEF